MRKCKIKVKCCLAGKHSPFIFPDDTVPVSGIYHIQSSHNVQSAYVLQLKHSVDVKDASQYSFIHIVYADSSFSPPYRFHLIKKGIITGTDAKVLLSKFSWFAIVADGTKIQKGDLPLCTLRHFAWLKQAPNFNCIFPPGMAVHSYHRGLIFYSLLCIVTSQMIYHRGASLSKQHMADVLFCHGHTAGLSLSTVCGYKPNLIMHYQW